MNTAQKIDSTVVAAKMLELDAIPPLGDVAPSGGLTADEFALLERRLTEEPKIVEAVRELLAQADPDSLRDIGAVMAGGEWDGAQYVVVGEFQCAQPGDSREVSTVVTEEELEELGRASDCADYLDTVTGSLRFTAKLQEWFTDKLERRMQ